MPFGVSVQVKEVHGVLLIIFGLRGLLLSQKDRQKNKMKCPYRTFCFEFNLPSHSFSCGLICTRHFIWQRVEYIIIHILAGLFGPVTGPEQGLYISQQMQYFVRSEPSPLPIFYLLLRKQIKTCPQEVQWLCLCMFLFLEVRCWQIGSDFVTLTKGEERREGGGVTRNVQPDLQEKFSMIQPVSLPPEESLQPNPLGLRRMVTGRVCGWCHPSHHGCPTRELLQVGLSSGKADPAML